MREVEERELTHSLTWLFGEERGGGEGEGTLAILFFSSFFQTQVFWHLQIGMIALLFHLISHKLQQKHSYILLSQSETLQPKLYNK